MVEEFFEAKNLRESKKIIESILKLSEQYGLCMKEAEDPIVYEAKKELLSELYDVMFDAHQRLVKIKFGLEKVGYEPDSADYRFIRTGINKAMKNISKNLESLLDITLHHELHS